jgi:hypothetical protein
MKIRFIWKELIDAYTKLISNLYVGFLDIAVYISGVLFLISIFFQPEIIVNFILYILIGLILLIKIVESKPRIKKILKRIVLILSSFTIFLFINLYFGFSDYLKIRFESAQKIIEGGLGQFQLIILSIIMLFIISIVYFIFFISLIGFILIKIKNNKFKKCLVITISILMLIVGEMIFSPFESWDMSRLQFWGGFSLLFLHVNYFLREILLIERFNLLKKKDCLREE